MIGLKRPPAKAQTELPEMQATAYPTRYFAHDNQGVWVWAVADRLRVPGSEVACFSEWTETKGGASGIGVEVHCTAEYDGYDFENQRRLYKNLKYVADCSAEGPNQYRRQIRSSIQADSLDGIKQKVSEWVAGTGRPFVAREAANQVDRLIFHDDRGAWPGSLRGLQDPDRDHVYVELDDPEAFWAGRGAYRRHKDGWVFVPVAQVTFEDGRAFR